MPIYPDVDEKGVAIPQYKFKRLSFTFWGTWNQPKADGKTVRQTIYSIAATLVFQRFKKEEALMMMIGWTRKHGYKKYSPRFLASVITETIEWSLQERRRIEREQKRRYRARQKFKERAKQLTEDLKKEMRPSEQ